MRVEIGKKRTSALGELVDRMDLTFEGASELYALQDATHDAMVRRSFDLKGQRGVPYRLGKFLDATLERLPTVRNREKQALITLGNMAFRATYSYQGVDSEPRLALFDKESALAVTALSEFVVSDTAGYAPVTLDHLGVAAGLLDQIDADSQASHESAAV